MSNLAESLSTAVPFLAKLLIGPLSVLVGRFISQTLTGRSQSKPEELIQALANATEEQLAKLKRADTDFQNKMKELGLDETKRFVIHPELLSILSRG